MSKITVIVADDHVLVREGLCRLLENEEDLECVAVAGDGKEAVRLAQEFLPNVAIVDVSMPEMSGIEAVKEIKKVSPTTAILMLSAYNYEHYVASCVEAGADGYLLKKNLPSDGISNAVRMVYAGDIVFDHEAARLVLSKLAAGKGKGGVGSGELSGRELQVLKLATNGMSNKEIASHLRLSRLTVGTHFVHIFRKLGVESRMEAALHALREGWLSLDDLDYKGEI